MPEKEELRLNEAQYERWSSLMDGPASNMPPELCKWLEQVGHRYGSCLDQLYNLTAAYVRGETTFAGVSMPTVA